MRRSVLTGLFACLVLAAASNMTASAEAQSSSIANQLQGSVSSSEAITPVILVIDGAATKAPVEAPAEPPEPRVHEVAQNENLSTIADQYGTTWVRIFNKNEQISQPDTITVGDKITIPEPDEVLAERPLPEAPVFKPAAPRLAARTPRTTRFARGSSSGNTYASGYCTWYAKDRRRDLPNNLGNASTWVSRAAAQGIPTGSEPRAGAIGQQGNHVVYVESVNGDGTVNVSEMNYEGLYVISRRTVPASYFRYIY